MESKKCIPLWFWSTLINTANRNWYIFVERMLTEGGFVKEGLGF